ncbi:MULTISPECIES: acyl carrier protein [Actinomadura]|uniref:Acyl carrier protein n=1 Tax=Actinomadura madurae TaxID=1993 RepID=A0A1I5TK26_9ACTN|nr:acyl carrier protein [Actinomadura madurae]SFP82997.1 acyl carrier protein [Actinomadura madurae]SPT51712.1 acyl carrier protein [Actinomadura madurae]
MERTGIIEHIRRSLTVALDREVTGLRETTALYEELGLDSAGTLELLLVLEDTLGFEVDPEELETEVFRTAGSLADYVAGHLVTTVDAGATA